jgi:linoleoyl-CoA desaturase
MSVTTLPKFNNSDRAFYSELRKRVDAYFKEKNLSKSGNMAIYIKTLVILGIYFVPYFLILFNVTSNHLLWFAMTILMGFGYACIGMCIMHDTSHGSFSKSTMLNRIICEISTLVLGAFPVNWKIQHNMIHHTYTNVVGHDEDIDVPQGLMRFDPHTKPKFIHRFQIAYAWIFYSMMSLLWITTKDFSQLIRYKKNGWLKQSGSSLSTEFPKLIIFKLLYHSYMLLPLFVVPGMTFLTWLTGMLILHSIAGLTLALVFQSAHVVQESEFALPTDQNQIENNWAEHQLRTTMNFAMKDRVFSWFVGGLNFQVEHHLFPNICHVHYHRISPIVERTAREFNIPYLSRRTFAGALWSHGALLYRLGRA